MLLFVVVFQFVRLTGGRWCFDAYYRQNSHRPNKRVSLSLVFLSRLSLLSCRYLSSLIPYRIRDSARTWTSSVKSVPPPCFYSVTPIFRPCSLDFYRSSAGRTSAGDVFLRQRSLPLFRPSKSKGIGNFINLQTFFKIFFEKFSKTALYASTMPIRSCLALYGEKRLSSCAGVRKDFRGDYKVWLSKARTR